jgi:Fur family ferric uptake transcriptional regulator
MPKQKQDITTVLRDNGLSVTRQRLLVFETLENREPVTMYELYDLVKDRLDRASLYRIVTAYEKLGIVSRINIGWKYKIELSDTFADHHHHLTCMRCDNITPMNENELEAFIEGLASSHKFTPLEHQIEIQGYCNKCASL